MDVSAHTAVELALHAGKALVDAVPAGGDEVDEQREVVHAGMPLGQEVVLEAFQAADRLPGQAAYLCKLPADRSCLDAHALADRILDPTRKRRLELRCKLCERLDLSAGPLERSIDIALGGAPGSGVVQPFSCACHRSFVHGPER